MAARIIKELWRFPVKSFRGETLDRAEFQTTGLLGDRAYALIERQSNKVVSAKSTKRYPNLLDCRAEFMEPPQAGRPPPPVKMVLPDGAITTSDSPEADEILSEYFGLEVSLATVAPGDYTVDQYHPDVEGIHPAGYRNVSIEQKLGSALFAELGLDSAIPVGSFLDAFPLSVMTTSTLARLSDLNPDSNFDVSRFRMNMIVETNEPGFVENTWLGGSFDIGESMRMRVAMPDPRCVMATLAQNGLPKDNAILKTLAQHNQLKVAGAKFPCAGVYAVITVPGSVQVGDAVSPH